LSNSSRGLINGEGKRQLTLTVPRLQHCIR